MAEEQAKLLPEVYTLIHSFLVGNSHEKAAKAVKKAAKAMRIEIVKEKAGTSSLPQILQELQEARIRITSLESQLKAEKTQDSKDSPSSSSESETDSGKSDSSDSSSDDEEDSNVRAGIGMKKAIIKPVLNATPDKEDSVEFTKVLASAKPSHKSAAIEETTTAVTKVTKKRKLENGTVTTAVDVSVTSHTDAIERPNGKPPRKTNQPFQRIDTAKLIYADDRLKDNSFESRGASANDYGAKASADLIVTRGAGFRKEKNKKKRGSYRGGEISLRSHSIKFDD